MVVIVLVPVAVELDVRAALWFQQKLRCCVTHVLLRAPVGVQEHVGWVVLEVVEELAVDSKLYSAVLPVKMK